MLCSLEKSRISRKGSRCENVLFFFCCWFFFESSSHFLAKSGMELNQVGLELTAVFLPQYPMCGGDNRHGPPHPAYDGEQRLLLCD